MDRARTARPRRTQIERRQEAVQKILDTAEAIFVANGFNGTTLNEVAKSVGVDTDKLFDAVLERRSHHVNAIRRVAFDAYEAAMRDAIALEGFRRLHPPGVRADGADEGLA